MPGSVGRADGWRRYESKYLNILVTGINLTGKTLRFAVMRQAGAPPIIEKTTGAGGIVVTGASLDTARVSFDPDDYGDLPAGVYSGVLWSDTDESQLWPQPEHTGDLYLAPAHAPTGINDVLTLSGNEQTDASRALASQGDGLSAMDGMGIWEGTTNLAAAISNMSFEGLTPLNNLVTYGWTNSTGGSTVVSTDQAKFGVQSGKLTPGGASTFQRAELILGVLPAGTYSASIWVYAPQPLSRVRIGLQNAADGTTLGTDQAVTNVWRRITVTKTTTISQSLTLILYMNYAVNLAAAEVLYLDGVQVELKPVPTPFALASRAASRVEMPFSHIETAQGWIAARLRLGWNATLAPTTYPRVFDANIDTSNGLHVFYNTFGGANRWAMKTENAAVNEEIDSEVQTFLAGASVTVIGFWKATSMGISANGAAFQTIARAAGLPDLSVNTTFDIGREHFQATSYLDGDVLWFACGKGVLTNADAAAIHAIGDTNPSLSQFPVEAEAKAIWAALTDAYTRSFAA